MGISEGRYPLSRLGDGHDHSLLKHLIKSALHLLPIHEGNLPAGMLDRGNTRASPDGIGPRHIPYDIKEAGKACFREIMSWTMTVVQGEATLVDFYLRADLVFKLGGAGDMLLEGWFVVDEGLLHCVPFIIDADSLKLTLREAVFLKPLRPWG